MVSVAPLTFYTTDPSEIVDVIEFPSALTVADLALAIPDFHDESCVCFTNFGSKH